MQTESPLLRARHLSTGYGQSTVINDLSLDVAPGEIVAILGLNGMGKSTLMRSLIGLLPARSTALTLGGKELSKLPPHERVQHGLAYVPQGRMVFPKLSVEENIVAGLSPKQRNVPEELYEFFPILREMKSRRGGNLSGGQQQQLVIARALAAEPKLLLLDEPTEGIQPSIIKDLAQLLVRIRDRKQLSLVVSEQVLSFALAIADRVLVMERGALIHESRKEDTNEREIAKMLSL
jgi:urea transport system ATP-binding protein